MGVHENVCPSLLRQAKDQSTLYINFYYFNYHSKRNDLENCGYHILPFPYLEP